MVRCRSYPFAFVITFERSAACASRWNCQAEMHFPVWDSLAVSVVSYSFIPLVDFHP
jgi:hypothetical protein